MYMKMVISIGLLVLVLSVSAALVSWQDNCSQANKDSPMHQ